MSVIALDIETLGDAAQLPAVVDMANAAEKDPEGFAALSPPLARIVCVGMRLFGDGREVAYFDASCFPGVQSPEPSHRACDNEADVLLKTNLSLSRGVTRIVTFRGRSFDLPVLIHRCVALGVPPCETLVKAAREYRYKPNLHVDLWDQFTFFGAASGNGCTLRAFAIGYGLPDPKANACGADVAALVERGDAAALVEYCLGDVRTTAALYERWLALCGVA